MFYGGKTPAGERRAARLREQGVGFVPPRLLWMAVTDGDPGARRRIEESARYVHDVYQAWAGEATTAGARADWVRDVRNFFHVCSPAEAVDLVGRQLEQWGTVEHVILGMCLPGLPDAIVATSMRLFATEVRPQLGG
jgi:hypothetical protein